ncbi:7906_t:CDS:2, partial [Ambispora gerdemannii]
MKSVIKIFLCLLVVFVIFGNNYVTGEAKKRSVDKRAPEPKAKAIVERAPEPKAKAVVKRAPEPKAKTIVKRAPEPKEAKAIVK